MTGAIDEQHLTALKDMLPPVAVLEAEEDKRAFLVEWRDKFHGETPLVLRPGTVGEVQAIVRYCAAHCIPLVPQGGNTGLVGGQLPYADRPALLISLSRLNAVRDRDPLNNTITVEAGLTLQDVQTVARDMKRLFPLSLAAEGSCQIGGNISSNAGGTAVLKYGNTRDLVLGLEVVLPDGELWDGLTGLRKDNTGYDLKHLFIGAEGTLGIVTAACLKLFPEPRDQQTAFVALETVDQAIRLLALAREVSGDLVTGFEIIPRIGLDFVLRHTPDTRDPMSTAFPWYILLDLSGGQARGDLEQTLEQILVEAMESELVLDAVIARSEQDRTDFWQLREALSEAQKPEGGSIKHDVSVPVSSMPAFILQATQACLDAIPDCRPVPFGHVGDGNVHFNVSQPVEMERETFLASWEMLSGIVHDIAAEMGGSISAEHGIGILKRDEMAERKSETTMSLMRRVKTALDPQGIMNPGKLLKETD